MLMAGCASIFLCAAVQPLAGDSPSGQSDYATVLAHDSCAPWDGPAVTLEFYTSPARCGEARSARLNINLWRGLPLKAGQKFELTRTATVGSASFCPQENQCEAAESGTVWIEGIEQRKSIAGRYEFAFRKAGRLAGKFRANWCQIRRLCG
jgi:hypothetical protein